MAAGMDGEYDARMSDSVTWRLAPYHDLTRDELYALLQLRQRVFIVEQSCPFLDADGAPLLGAYARLFAPGAMYDEASIGRVVTHPAARRGGLGRALMHEALARLAEMAPATPVRIGAQRYLERFYESLGFVVAGPEYLEDGIPHGEMVRTA